MEKVLVATRIDEKTHRCLLEIGDKEDRTVAYMVRRAIEEYIAHQLKPTRKIK